MGVTEPRVNGEIVTDPTEFHYAVEDGTKVFARRWASVASAPKAVVQIAHGAAEHSARYARFAEFLNRHSYSVYANDHRGHGRTRVRSGALGDAGADAWNHFVSDVRALTTLIRTEQPRLPVILFGHSMGSFIAQDYMARYPRAADAIVLCATNGVFVTPQPEVFAYFDAQAEQAPLAPSKFFSDRWSTYNDAFSPGKPGFDWLSRDAAEVQKYVDDPLCGFPFGNELSRDFLKGLNEIFRPERESTIAPETPVLVIAGDQDPVGGKTKTIEPMLDRYRAYGVQRLTVKFYPGARHELLNEINRDEVQADIVRWLDTLV